MFQFIGENILFVLTIFGAIVSFMASLVGLLSRKKPVLILATLAVLAFVVGIAYQIYDYNLSQDERRRKVAKEQITEAAQQARDNVVNEINLTVKQTKITVDSIAQQLDNSTLQEVATELVSIQTSSAINFNVVAAFAKGSPGMWFNYAGWLTSLDQSSVAPTLSLTVNANHHYDSGLLLAYLLTSAATGNTLKDVVDQHSAWHDFPAEAIYLKAFTSHTKHLQWVLFYEASTLQPVAYAQAQSFTRELMVYHRLKQHDKINQLLNAKGADTVSALKKAFPSIQTDVFKAKTPSQLVKLMIDRQLDVSVTFANNKSYVAKLVRMIQLAAKND